MIAKEHLAAIVKIGNHAERSDILKALGGQPDSMIEAIVALSKPATTRPEIETLTEQEFIDGMLRIPVSAFATVGMYTTIKNPALKSPVKNGTVGMITKLAVSQLVVNGNYARMVNNRMAKECEEGETVEDRFNGDFVAEPHAWADRVEVDGKPVGLVKHRKTGKLYLVAARIRSIGKAYWYFDGKPAEYTDIAHHFHPKQPDRQPQENKVQWRTIGIDSIQTVCITPNTIPRITHRFAITHD